METLYRIHGVWIIVLIFGYQTSMAQTSTTLRQFFSQYLRSDEGTEEVLLFNPGSGLTKQQFLSALQAPSNDVMPSYLSLVLKEERTDNLGTTRSKYLIVMNEVEIGTGTLNLQEREGVLTCVTSPSLNIPLINTVPSVSVIVAEENASDELTKIEVNGVLKNKLSASKLLVLKRDDGYSLAWKVSVYGETIYDRYDAFVDAYTGTVYKKVKSDKNCSGGTASVPTKYNGNQSINYGPTGSGDYLLKNDCVPNACSGSSSAIIHTQSWNNLGPPYGEFTDLSGTTWSTSDEYKKAYSVHWGLSKTFDFFYCEMLRNSFNDMGGSLIGYTNYTTGNANFLGTTNGVAEFGFGNNGGGSDFCYPILSLEVVAHEFTHAVLDVVGAGEYEPDIETHAVVESWCDIFGTAVEFYVEGSGANYTCGEDVACQNYIRSMSDPNLKGDPKYKNGSYWMNDTDCGANVSTCAHTNNGVGNHWFYLLSEGRHDFYGIGIDKATAIAYDGMLDFPYYVNYNHARALTIAAAQNRYGYCSVEAMATATAWYLVGVGNNIIISETVCGTFNNGTTQTFRADQVLNAGNCFGGTTINTGANITLLAGDYIVLQPDFVANPGATFLAAISPCGGGYQYYRKSSESTFAGKGGDPANSIVVPELDLLTIYPNPTTGSFTLSSTLKGSISISNSLGQELLTRSVLEDEKIDLDLSGQSKGLYFVKFSNESEIKTSKILIE